MRPFVKTRILRLLFEAEMEVDIDGLARLGVKVRNMKMVFNIRTLGVGSGNEH